MSGGGSGSVAPSTTTSVQDIPSWEQGYVTDLLGKAQAAAAQPYQQYPGQQVAGFTNDQNQAFSNVENLNGTFQPTTQAGVNSALQGAQTAGGIYNAGAGKINEASSYNPLAAVAPYLGAASQYNTVNAEQPYLNQAQAYNQAAAEQATPEGIQKYLNPYTNNVVKGIQDEANQNWKQNIMPGLDDTFVGSGSFGSGRNAQVLGQAAGNFQTGLSANVANALAQGYTTAGQQAATQAGILGNAGNASLAQANTAGNAQNSQIANLLNQAGTAGSATQNQANNLVQQGNSLGNLAATQGQGQINAANTLGNLGNTQLNQGITYNAALQGVGQQQQQLNQQNLTTAQNNFNDQKNYNEQQLQFLNQIIRGLPTPTSITSAGQNPVSSVSPLNSLAGLGVTGLAAGNGKKRGGIIKGYKDGGTPQGDDSDEDQRAVDDDSLDASDVSPLTQALSPIPTPTPAPSSLINQIYGDDTGEQDYADNGGNPTGHNQVEKTASPSDALNSSKNPINQVDDSTDDDTESDASNPLSSLKPPQQKIITPAQAQQLQLLSIARGLVTPQPYGQSGGAAASALGNYIDTTFKTNQLQAQQANTDYERQLQRTRLGIEQQNADTNKSYRDWRMNNTGVGSYDTQARLLMKDNHDLTYTDALAMAVGKNFGGSKAASPAPVKVASTTSPSGVPNIDPETGDVTPGKFGFDVSNIPPKVYSSMANEDSKRRQADVNNIAIAKNVHRMLDQLEPNFNNTGTGGYKNYISKGAEFIAPDSDTGTATANIQKGTNDLALELNKFQPVAGTRSSVLQLKTILASKPGLEQPKRTNQNIINGLRAKVTDFQLTGELAQQYREASPLKITDQNTYKLDDALKTLYPLEKIDPKTGVTTFNADNAQKIRDTIPDAIANPDKYFSLAKGKSLGATSNLTTPSGPAGLPDGAVLIGTSQGKKVYQLSDGSKVREQ